MYTENCSPHSCIAQRPPGWSKVVKEPPISLTSASRGHIACLPLLLSSLLQPKHCPIFSSVDRSSLFLPSGPLPVHCTMSGVFRFQHSCLLLCTLTNPIVNVSQKFALLELFICSPSVIRSKNLADHKDLPKPPRTLIQNYLKGSFKQLQCFIITLKQMQTPGLGK